MRSFMLNVIGYPRRLSEFEMQATIYSALRAMKVDCRGCVPARCEDFGRHPKCYFDLVVFGRNKMPVVIVEVKVRREKSPEARLGSRQHRRYSKFNVPLVVCDRESKIFPTVDRVIELAWKSGGISL
jgi:hypothetical protein